MMHIRRAVMPHFMPMQRVIVEETRQPKMKKINQYLLRSKLGSGSSSKVYLAKDENSGQFYAAKAVQVLERRHNGLGAAGLEREIRIMRRLNHPNIVQLHDVLYASQADTAYLFIEWADCGTLQDAISNFASLKTSVKTIDEPVLASIFKQVLVGLSYLHSQGIVHKDLKPSNILLFSSGDAKLSDFGIGHSFQSAEAVVGTPAYQAPELFEDEEETSEEIDPTKGDIWSLGVSLYEAAFGVLPYYGSNMYEIVRAIYNTELIIPENRGYSQSLVDLIKKMLCVDQNERISLEDVMNHEFFKNASSTPDFKALRTQTNKELAQTTTATNQQTNVKIVKVNAVICPENYSFASELRSFSCPGSFPSIANGTDSPMIEKTNSLDSCDHLKIF